MERSTRYVMLLHLPEGHDATTVRDRMIPLIKTLPDHLRRSFGEGDVLVAGEFGAAVSGQQTWPSTSATPTHHGNADRMKTRLLRQYFPKSTNLAVHTPEDLVAVAAGLIGRPRKTLGSANPAEAMQQLLSDPSRVATTP